MLFHKPSLSLFLCFFLTNSLSLLLCPEAKELCPILISWHHHSPKLYYTTCQVQLRDNAAQISHIGVSFVFQLFYFILNCSGDMVNSEHLYLSRHFILVEIVRANQSESLFCLCH